MQAIASPAYIFLSQQLDRSKITFEKSPAASCSGVFDTQWLSGCVRRCEFSSRQVRHFPESGGGLRELLLDGLTVILIVYLNCSLGDSTHLYISVSECVLLGDIHIFLRVTGSVLQPPDILCSTTRRSSSPVSQINGVLFTT